MYCGPRFASDGRESAVIEQTLQRLSGPPVVLAYWLWVTGSSGMAIDHLAIEERVALDGVRVVPPAVSAFNCGDGASDGSGV